MPAALKKDYLQEAMDYLVDAEDDEIIEFYREIARNRPSVAGYMQTLIERHRKKQTAPD